jgi:type I restriction enzyme S subunit
MLLEGWRGIKFGRIADFRNGLNFSQGSQGASVKVVGVGDFSGREIYRDYSELEAVRIPGPLDDQDLLKDGDLLFVRSNGNRALIGRCLLFGNVKEPVSFSGFTIRARVNDDSASPAFLAYVMRSSAVRNQFAKLGGGTNISNLNQEILNAIQLALPPLEEQHQICRVLSTWDRAAETIEGLIRSGQKQREALTQLLLWGKIRLGRYATSDGTQLTSYGKIPSSWRFMRIEQIAEEVSIRNTANEVLPVLACSKHVGFVKSLEYFKKKIYSDDLSTYKVAPRGTFGFPANHIEEGSIGYQNVSDAGLVSPIYCLFRTKGSVCDSYLYRLFKTEHYRQIFSAATNSSVDRRGSLRWSEFSKLHVPLPTFEEQESIARVIEAADAETNNLVKQLQNVRIQRNALMEELLVGKLRVASIKPAEVTRA